MIKRFKTQLLIIVLLQTVICYSCKVSKDIAIPDVKLPEEYRNTAYVDGTTSASGLTMMDFFQNPELRKLLAKAVTRNNDLLIAVKNIEASRLVLRQSRLGNVPVINLQATGSFNRPSDNSFNGLNLNKSLNTSHVEDYSLSAGLSWEADIWGKIASRKAGALASYLQTGEAKNAVQTAIVAEVAKGYYNLVTLDKLLNIAQKNLRLNDSTLQIIQMQFAAGQVTSLAVQQAAAQRLVSAELIPGFEQRINIQENALSVLTGEYPVAIDRTDRFSPLPRIDSISAGVPAALLSQRPDVKIAEFELSRANAEVGFAKAAMYPSFTITAQSGLESFKAGSWFNIPASLFGTLAGSITQPLFNQQKLRTQYNLSKIRREQSVIRFRQSVLIAVEDVSDALVKLSKLKQEEDLETQRVRTLQLATTHSQQLFKSGLATYLEVVFAQGNVLQSELELVNIKKARLDAMVDLYRAVGGGWK